jgi:hypothetical protein
MRTTAKNLPARFAGLPSVTVIVIATSATRLTTTRFTTTGATAAARTSTTTARPTASSTAGASPTAATAKTTSATRTATASTKATGTTAAESTPATARGFGSGFVNVQGTSAQFFPIQGCNRFLSFSGIGHLDEGEAARPASITVGDYTYLINFSVRFEKRSQFGFSCAVWDVTDKKLLHGIPRSFTTFKCELRR